MPFLRYENGVLHHATSTHTWYSKRLQVHPPSPEVADQQFVVNYMLKLFQTKDL
jgi:hypothetical protein